MKYPIAELVFGFLVGAIIVAVLTFVVFYRDIFAPIPTLVPSAEPLPTAQVVATVLPSLDRVLISPTETPLLASVTETSPPSLATATEAELVLPTPASVSHQPVSSADITAVGDSVMLGGALELRKRLDGLDIDARVGRQPAAAVDTLRSRYAAGQLGRVVIVHIGNNGPFTAEQIDEIIGLCAGVRQVVFVNVKVPRRWEGLNNATLAEKVQHYPNVALVDWYGASVNRPELFYDDGVHLRPEGARAYAELIAANLAGP